MPIASQNKPRPVRPRGAPRLDGRWSRKHERCIGCGTTKTPHAARGFCKRCNYYGGNSPPPVPSNRPDVIRLYDAGKNLCEIAKQLGVTRQRVHQIVGGRADRNAVVPRVCQRCGANYQGRRATHLCEQCTKTPSRMNRPCPMCGVQIAASSSLCFRCSVIKRNRHSFFNPRTVSDALRLYRSGWGYHRIAKRIGCCDATVKRIIIRFGTLRKWLGGKSRPR